MRSIAEIFHDLEAICCQPGFLHALSRLIFRDCFISFNREGTLIQGSTERHSRATLNTNEIMLLCGLLAKSTTQDVFSEISDTNPLIERVDSLLEEFHIVLEAPIRESISRKDFSSSFADFAKEAMYYGAQSAYASQYQTFSKYRYKFDSDWLLKTKGISIQPIIKISQFISSVVNMQMTALRNFTDIDPHASPQQLSNALLIAKKTLRDRFGSKVDSYLKLFSLPINESNRTFGDPFQFNEANAKPLLDIGEHIYLASQFRLFESIYESPYFWMQQDKNYKDMAATNRGRFLEKSTSQMLKNVFGNERVFSNVIIRKENLDIAAEADVLVIFGEFVLVFQAKSKRITLQARSGDAAKLHEDFNDSVQAAYNQAIKFIELLRSGAACEIEGCIHSPFEGAERFFPIVVLSDHFPSQTVLSNHLVEISNGVMPAICDIFFLDVLFELLNDPTEVLFYFQERSRFFARVETDSEFNLLGFHLKGKLYVPEGTDMMFVDRGFADEIDDYYFARDAGIKPAFKFSKLEDRVGVAEIKSLITFLKSGLPTFSGMTIELLGFSAETLQNFANMIGVAQREVRGGKAFKSFSFETNDGGITYAVVDHLGERSMAAGSAVGARHKYRFKKSRWYVVLDVISSPAMIDAVLPLYGDWSESEEMNEWLKKMDAEFNSRIESFEKKPNSE